MFSTPFTRVHPTQTSCTHFLRSSVFLHRRREVDATGISTVLALVKRGTTASKHVPIVIARHGGAMHHKFTRVQASHPLLCFQSFVLHGTVTNVIIRPNNHIFVPVSVDFWRIETSDKRAPGDIFHMNARSNPTKMMHRTATPQITPLKTTHGIRPLLGRCDDPNHRWWTGSNRPRFTSLAFVATLTKVRPPFCIPIDPFQLNKDDVP